ncbi:hypothetical protein FA10DRAFT_268643 [Acaromyces ingoldii]|uniref:EF-hand domain-containing protein n=1 Tax=Acaromyces ingoldii TaxID=215250 RepID=A0A316YGX3_9BASI|nr:hypothetical protein FA10DRAFT_268643 [Acaromyces ingoldii]PWN88449.1 hypothetical protein FA10DRAFT_268643 [Acaromyces ingoldii]
MTTSNSEASGSGTHDASKYNTLVGGQYPGEKVGSGYPPTSSHPHPYSHHPHHHNANGHGYDDGAESSADETDDFDWDTDSSADGNEDVLADGTKRIRAKRGRAAYLALMRLARPVRLFIVGILGTAIFLTPFIVVLAAFKHNPARQEVEAWSIWLGIIWASACGTFLVMDWLPPSVLKIGVAFWGKAPELFSTIIEVLIATMIWTKLVLVIAWAWISLGGVLSAIYNAAGGNPRPAYFKWVFLVLQALFGSGVLLLAEKICLQFIAINFHKTALKDRLENNQKALKALDRLADSKYLNSGAQSRGRMTPNWGRLGFGSRPATPGATGGHAAKPSRDGLGGYFGASTPAPGPGGEMQQQQQPPQTHSPQHRRTGSKTPNEKDQRKANFSAQLADALATATMKNSKLYRNRGSGSQLSARKLAKKLFHNLGHHQKTDFLTADDFQPFFDSREDAREAFSLFDADGNGDLTKTEMRDAVQRIYKERRALSTSLKDMSSAVSKLDGVLLGIVLIIWIFIWLLIFNGDNTVANIAPLSTFVVGFSFIFGNSAKTLFESMVFIFATHPYDVGDLVCIDDNFMFVVEFGLISTTFRTVVNQYIVAPNALLAQNKFIFNCRRSGGQWEVTFIQVGYDSTVMEMVEIFRQRMKAWVKENDREWGGGLEVNLQDFNTNANSINLCIAMEHKGNWQDWGARWSRRTKLMRQVKIFSDEIGMKYQLPPQPVTFRPVAGPSPHVPRAPRMPGAAANGGSGGGGGGGGLGAGIGAGNGAGGTMGLPVGGMGRVQQTMAQQQAASS